MSVSPRFALPYPEPPDPADVPADMKALVDRLDAILGGAGAIPGEVRLWAGSAVPAIGTYGRWVWADGATYVVATYPKAAANIANQWRTFGGLADPGAANFRVPDLRGLVPAGLDAMPGGARANRVARANGATLAALTGAENVGLTVAQLPSHDHPVNDPTHAHVSGRETVGLQQGPTGYAIVGNRSINDVGTTAVGTGVTVGANGGGGAHENMQPSVMVPWIVKLDD